MPRHKCCRKVGLLPDTTLYRPEGNLVRPGEEVVLSLDELEAVRLADFAGLYQEDAAARMDISRQTFGRIIETARKKIADALINGKSLRIEGGNVSIENQFFRRCDKCRKSTDCANRFKEGNCPRRLNEPIKL
ncbi:MAG: DUF134 domain-containing protein [Spirochaetes bacterium]|jgi:predicted DNA-binding protein (UPF0251 family)|nr:DUF134 domain-containing protein [Spirochaetota bacterium]